MNNKKFKYDGKSRPTTDLYKKEFDRIFKTNPVEKRLGLLSLNLK
jgi:hypothetical protein